MSEEKRGSVVGAMFVMLILSFLLGIFLPTIGPLIAGVVGGKMAKTVGNAVLASLLPALLLGIAVWLLSTFLMGIPVIGLIFGLGLIVIVALNTISLIVGAIIGAIIFD